MRGVGTEASLWADAIQSSYARLIAKESFRVRLNFLVRRIAPSRCSRANRGRRDRRPEEPSEEGSCYGRGSLHRCYTDRKS